MYLESDHLSFRSVCIIYLLDCCQNHLIVPFLSHAAAKMIIEKCIQSTSLPFSKPCIPFNSCLECAFHVQMYSSDIIVSHLHPGHSALVALAFLLFPKCAKHAFVQGTLLNIYLPTSATGLCSNDICSEKSCCIP